jgi:hypothetical protein
MLKGDRIFNSFLTTKQKEPLRPTFKKSTTIHLGINLLRITPEELMQFEWWKAQRDCRMNKKLLEKVNLAHRDADFEPNTSMFTGGAMYRVS